MIKKLFGHDQYNYKDIYHYLMTNPS